MLKTNGRRLMRPDCIPNRPSYIYFLYDEDELLYIGRTRQLRERLNAHRCDAIIPFTRYETVAVEATKLSAIETRLIKQFQPKYNLRHTDKEFEYEVSDPADISDVEHVFARDDLAEVGI
jgi:excinuclease UvrABC nuclease subunit